MSKHPIPDWLRSQFSRIEDEVQKLGPCGVFTQMRTVTQTYFEQQAEAAQPPACCTPTAEENALLAAGDYRPEELWGVGGKPSCPKCYAAPQPPALGGETVSPCPIPGHQWPTDSDPKTIAYVDESDVVVVIGESAWRRKAYVDFGRAIPDAWVRLIDRAHLATLQAENKRLDLMVAQADHNYDADRAEWNRERDQLRAQRDELHRMLGLAWGDGDVSAEDCRKIDATLSRPAGSES